MIHVALFGIEAGLGGLLTYLVHSTVWVVGALLLTRLDRALAPAARHTVWRAALLGPFASSAFSLGIGHGWQWAPTLAASANEAWVAAAPPAAALRDSVSHTPLLQPVTAPQPVFAVLAGVWAIGALVGVLLLARAAVRQRRALEPRTPIARGASIEALGRLTPRTNIRQPVRLSRTAAASTPLVLGSREICLPERALELEREALDAVLAHELAHIERRDILWLNGALFLQMLLWFQPLLRKARAELRESAELAADDRAVELTGDALGLARTLTHVASWASAAPLAPSVAMARPESPIVQRVARLVEPREPRHRFGSRSPWFALGALAAFGACSPSVGAPQAEAPRAALQPSSAPASAPGANPSEPSPPEPVAASNPAEPDDANPPPPPPSTDAVHATDGPEAPPQAPMPELPIQSVVGEVVASVVPRAIEFSSSVTQLAMEEHQLQQQLERVQRAAAKRGAPREAREELQRLEQKLAASTRQRQRLEKDFEARMDAWGKQFEQRFERDHAPRFAAWGEEFGRRMQAMGKDLERQLAPLRNLSIPALPPPTIVPPSPPVVSPPVVSPPVLPQRHAPSPPRVNPPPATPPAPAPPR